MTMLEYKQYLKTKTSEQLLAEAKRCLLSKAVLQRIVSGRTTRLNMRTVHKIKVGSGVAIVLT